MVFNPPCQHFQHNRYLVLYGFNPPLPALSTRSLPCFIWFLTPLASTFNTIVILFYMVLIPHCQHFQHDRYLVLYGFNPPLPALSTQSLSCFMWFLTPLASTFNTIVILFYMVFIPHCQHFQHDRYLVLYGFFPHRQHFQHDRYLVLYGFYPPSPALSTRSLSCFIWFLSPIASTFNTIVILFYMVFNPHRQHFQHDRYLVLYEFFPTSPALSTRLLTSS